MKTNEEINQYFTEEVFRKCWHEAEDIMVRTIHNNKTRCAKCKELQFIINGCDTNISNPDYFTEKGFFVIWKWAIDQEWWYTFVGNLYERKIFLSPIINHKTFAREVCNFLEVNK